VRDRHGGDDRAGVSWLTLADLLAYDYSQEFEDLRPFPGDPPRITVRNHVGEMFFQHLDELGKLGVPEDVRIVFWFGC
jgi:hypothetical protein